MGFIFRFMGSRISRIRLDWINYTVRVSNILGPMERCKLPIVNPGSDVTETDAMKDIKPGVSRASGGCLICSTSRRSGISITTFFSTAKFKPLPRRHHPNPSQFGIIKKRGFLT